MGQGGSPFGCRAGAGAEAGEAEAQAVLQVDHKRLQLGRRYSCSGICLILCGIKNPQDSENHMGFLSVLKPEGGTMAMLEARASL